MIKLYGVPGSRAIRSLWMLEEVGVPYENVKIGFSGETRQPEFLAINPNGHVPALQDGDYVIWESMAINLYLARKYDKGLWPKTVEDEGHAYQWSVWAMTEVEDPLVTAMLHRAFLPEAQRVAALADAAQEKLKAPFAVVDAHLRRREYLIGSSFTVADLNVASVIGMARMARIDVSTYQHMSAWLARCGARPAYARLQSKM